MPDGIDGQHRRPDAPAPGPWGSAHRGERGPALAWGWVGRGSPLRRDGRAGGGGPMDRATAGQDGGGERPRVGAEVVGADITHVGVVKAVREDDFLLARPLARDL